MPITFEVIHEAGYYLARWRGRITDQELLEDYKSFFESGDWVPGHNSLADLSELDATDLSSDALRALAALVRRTFAPHGIQPKIAAYAPYDLPFGLARMYSVKVEAFESFRPFRDRDEALAWLRGDGEQS